MERNHHSQPKQPIRIDREADAVHGLGQSCVHYLAREEAFLEVTGESLRRAHAAAVAGERQQMAADLERLAKDATAMRQAREAFRIQAASVLGVREEAVTLKKLVGQLSPEMRQRLLEKQEQLRRRIVEVQQLGQKLALLSHYFLDFLKRFFIELTGGMKSSLYGRHGLRHEPACGSLLHTQG